MEYKENYPLAALSTFRIGGPALYYTKASSLEELKAALSFAREKGLGVQILGGVSNVLISDKGFDGLVIHIQIPGLQIEDSGLVTVSAGENWDEVVARTVEKDLAGLECLSGVPGSSGGAIVQNIGAYGETLSNFVARVYAVEIATGKEKEFSAEECEFGYRSSWFKRNPNKYVVTGFQLQLKNHGVPTTSYPHVSKHFANKPKPTLSDVRQFIIKLRANKGYVIMPGYESYATAGSFFKNPIVNNALYEKLSPMLGSPDLNRFWKTPNGIKLAAAYMMQEAGFGKGYREGNVGISPKHSLSLINLGEGTAAEIKALAEKIKAAVLEKFNVKLEEEVLFVGEI